MEIKGIIWIGSATENLDKTAGFFSDILGMETTIKVRGFTRLAAANGDLLEIFGPDSIEHEHLDTGPVAGFWVDNVEVARRELLDAEVEGVTELERGRDGHRWFYFRAPDGNFYELCDYPQPRPVKRHH